MIQPFSRTSPGEDLTPGLVLQDRTIVCWLNVAGDLVTAKKGKLYRGIPSYSAGSHKLPYELVFITLWDFI